MLKNERGVTLLGMILIVLCIIIILGVVVSTYKVGPTRVNNNTVNEINFENINNENNANADNDISLETENIENSTNEEKEEKHLEIKKGEYKITTQSKDNDEDRYAVLEFEQDGNVITKEVEMNAAICEVDILNIPHVGNVAIISESGGEYYGVNLYKADGKEIKEVGSISLFDLVSNAKYEAKEKNEDTVIIEADIDGKKITEEIKTEAAVANIDVIDILKSGKIVLVAETGGEYYGINVYGAVEDYITGEILGIKNLGKIEANF